MPLPFIDTTANRPANFRLTDRLGLKFLVPVENLKKVRHGFVVSAISTMDIWGVKEVEILDAESKVLLRADGGGTTVRSGEKISLELVSA